MVSVVIPSYERAGFIGRAIESVLAQTYQDFEILVVDDGSADGTRDVVSSFRDERIRYVRHEENKGAAAARNTGISDAKGEYIAFLDSDDEWMPEKLEKQIKLFSMSSDRVGVIYCGYISLMGKTHGSVTQRVPTVRGDAKIDTLRYCVVGCGSLPVVRKECFCGAGCFDENINLQSLEDWDFWIRVAKLYEFDFVPEVLVKRYLHGQQLTTGVLVKKLRARETILEKHKEDLARQPAILADHLNRLAVLRCLNGDLRTAKKFLIRSIIKRPLQRFAYAHFIPLVLMPGIYKKRQERYIRERSISGTALYW